jgi:superfamily II DNA or RNA helicase
LERACAKGRNIIVLGGRKEQLKLLAARMLELGHDADLVIGTTKKKARTEAFNAQLIFATWQLASRALDIPRLDMLVLLFPTTDETFLKQAVGRTDRSELETLVLTYSHNYNDTLKKREAEMVELVRRIDKKPTIKYVGQH